MYLGDRDLFVAAAVFTVAALAAASPDEYFRRAEDVKADPKLPPGSPYSPPEENRGGGEYGDAVFGESNYFPYGEDVRRDSSGGSGSMSSSVRDLLHSSSQNSSSHINYSYQDILRLGGSAYERREEGQRARQGRVLPLFTIVRFGNTACDSTDADKNGTCYTSAECATKGGTAAGTCASGFGVCCNFDAACGGTYSENSTYFTTQTATPCTITICKCQSDICYLRLNFDTFVITQPDDTQTTTGTQCLNDRFTVTAPGFTSPPTLCGTNTGDHMYVRASEACNELAMTQNDAMTFTRSWAIRIDQIPCDTDYTPPDNCLQYFTGISGTIQSFNYNAAAGPHLADQDQRVCIRPERGYCTIDYASAAIAGVFGVSGAIAATAIANDAMCMTDWVYYADFGRFCGTALPTLTSSAITPFLFQFITDSMEAATEDATANNGFRLDYTQTVC